MIGRSTTSMGIFNLKTSFLIIGATALASITIVAIITVIIATVINKISLSPDKQKKSESGQKTEQEKKNSKFQNNLTQIFAIKNMVALLLLSGIIINLVLIFQEDTDIFIKNHKLIYLIVMVVLFAGIIIFTIFQLVHLKKGKTSDLVFLIVQLCVAILGLASTIWIFKPDIATAVLEYINTIRKDLIKEKGEKSSQPKAKTPLIENTTLIYLISIAGLVGPIIVTLLITFIQSKKDNDTSSPTNRNTLITNIILLATATLIISFVTVFGSLKIVGLFNSIAPLVIMNILLGATVSALLYKILQSQKQDNLFALILQLYFVVLVFGVTLWIAGTAKEFISGYIGNGTSSKPTTATDIKNAITHNTTILQKTIKDVTETIQEVKSPPTLLLGRGKEKYENAQDASVKNSTKNVAQNIADRQFDLGTTQYQEMDLRKSAKTFKQTYKLYQNLVKKDDDKYNRALAMTQYNLGIIYSDLKQLKKAPFLATKNKILNSYEEALEGFCALAQENLEEYNKYVEFTLMNMSELYFDEKFQTKLETEAQINPDHASKDIIELIGKHRNQMSYQNSLNSTIDTLETCGPDIKQLLEDNEVK